MARRRRRTALRGLRRLEGPAILGHAANNSLALVMLWMIDRSTSPPTVNPMVGFLVLGAMGSFAVGVVLLIVAGRPVSWRDVFSSPRS